MKTNWQTKKLGDVFEKESSNVSQNQLVNKDGKYPIFGASGLVKNINFFHQDKEYISIIKDGAGIGRITLLPAYSSVIGTLQYLIPKEGLDLKFLYFFLSSIDFIKYRNGSTIPHIYFKDYAFEPILVPPLSEQHHIVKILDKVFGEIEKAKKNTEKNLQNARDLFESYLRSIFTNSEWAEKTLKEISIEFSRGKSKHRPRNDKKLYGGKYPFIQTGDIRNSNHFIRKYSQTYNEVGLEQSKLWPKGTICITIAANIAETGILNFSSCFPDSVIGLIVDPKKAHEEFIEYLLFFFKTKIKSKGKGSAQANINMGTFEFEKFPIPNISEQKFIVKKLDLLSEKTKKLEEIYRQKLANLEELKKSILKKAFAGEL